MGGAGSVLLDAGWDTGGVTQTQPAPPTRGAKRYPRTFGGLIAAMVVTVVAVVGYWLAQNATRDTPEMSPEPVDYLEAVTLMQGAGLTVAYPASLPAGWTATSVHPTAGDEPSWGLGMLTDDGKFAGVRQEDASTDELVETYVDEGAEPGDEVSLDSPIAQTWTTWSDEKGDHAYAAELGDEVLLVYGSAPVEDLRALAESLTTAAYSPGS